MAISQGLLCHGGIGWDTEVSFSFYICFCVRFIRSVKDLLVRIVEKILMFVIAGFPKIHSCLSVLSELNFLDMYISVCLMNDEDPIALS